MKKKELNQRIKELEMENELLRSLLAAPTYVYLYQTLPYNPYWQYSPRRYLPSAPCDQTWVTWPTTGTTWVTGSVESTPVASVDDPVLKPQEHFFTWEK